MYVELLIIIQQFKSELFLEKFGLHSLYITRWTVSYCSLMIPPHICSMCIKTN